MYSKKEIETNADRFDFLIKVLKELIEHIEPNYLGNNHWYTIGIMFGKKFLTQTTTLQALYRVNISFHGKPDDDIIVDIASISIILRTLFETFAVFNHLFVPESNIEENIVRFRLWELDGYLSRQKLRERNVLEFDDKTDQVNNYTEQIIAAINQLPYFKNLDSKRQQYLLKNCAWKFTSASLNNKENRKWKISIKDLLINAGLTSSFVNNLYYFFSNHAHSAIFSVIDDNLDSIEKKLEHKYMSIFFASTITSLIIKGLETRYKGGKQYLEALPREHADIINSLVKFGKGEPVK